jgi:hypothetical protein
MFSRFSKVTLFLFFFLFLINFFIRRPFVDHLVERFFKQIIECSDVGINPEDEEELEELKAYGLETGEKEDKSEYVLKVK